MGAGISVIEIGKIVKGDENDTFRTISNNNSAKKEEVILHKMKSSLRWLDNLRINMRPQ